MTSRTRRLRRAAGFTLVEVLAAFMILAVGLLALEALGIGAARMVARAERLGEYNSEALTQLEESLSAIRLNQNPGTETIELQGATLDVVPTRNGRFWTVRVTVRPAGDEVLAVSDSFSVTGNVFR